MIIKVPGRVAELERRLAKDSSTSSKPPSSDGLAKRPAPAWQRRAGGRRPGRQPGTPGAHLAQVPFPDEVVVHAPERCAGRGGALTLAAVCCSGRPMYRARLLRLVGAAATIVVTPQASHKIASMPASQGLCPVRVRQPPPTRPFRGRPSLW
jgi:Family of unknown function (DUF6444)